MPPSEPLVSDSLIVVHGKCADGLTSAGLLLRRLPRARVRYTQPAELAEALEHAAAETAVMTVVLADLSPQLKDAKRVLASLELLQQRKAKVAWLDHHAPQWSSEFEASVKRLGVDLHVDHTETESGASLAAAWAQEKDPQLLRVADLIRRRDAWTHPHDPQARAWTLVALEDEEYVQRLAAADLRGLEEKGEQLLKWKEESIARSLAHVRRHDESVHYLWGEDDISDVADRLFDSDPKAILLLRFGKSGRVSVRSRGDREAAAPFAQQMGGGGHANAAGFTLTLPVATRLWYRIRRHGHPIVKDALRKASEVAARPAPAPTPTAGPSPPTKGARPRAPASRRSPRSAKAARPSPRR